MSDVETRGSDTIGFRRGAAQPAAPPAQLDDRTNESAGRPRRWLAVAAALTACAWLALGGLALTGRGPFAAADPVRDSAAPPDPAVAGVAEAFVVAYLEAGEGDAPGLDALAVTGVDRQGMRAGERYVRHAQVVGMDATGDHGWMVTVAADVLVAVDGGYAAGRRKWYSVPVLASGTHPVVTSAPAEIAPPRAAREAPAPATSPAPEAIEAAAGRAVSGYLTGDPTLGDPLPDPYTTANVLDVLLLTPASAAEARARVRVTAVDADGRQIVLDYDATLEDTGAGWQVTELEGAHPAPPA